MTEEKDARFWDKIARKYATHSIADQAGYERTLARCGTVLKPDDDVLELGCGTGSTAFLLAPKVRSYTATDLSSEMIAIATEKLEQTAVDGLRFDVGTAQSLPYPDNSLDAVLGFNYLHMVHDLPTTLKRIYDWLTPGGLFVSKTPCLGNMNPLLRHVAVPLMQMIGKAPHVASFNAETLQTMIRDAGFELDATERHGSKARDPRLFAIARKAA